MISHSIWTTYLFLLSIQLLYSVTTVYSSSSPDDEPDRNLIRRDRRDGYGGGYGGGGGGYGGGYGSGYSMGNYGCSCPYTSCDNKTDSLLAFGVGALLGLLLSMLRTMLLATTATNGTPGNGGRDSGNDHLVDFLHNVTWADETARFHHPQGSTLTKMLHLPEGFSDDLVPMVADLFQIYTDSGKRPECVRRWICEATQQSLKVGGLRARLGSLSSIAFGWYTKDLLPVIQNMISGSQDLDCKYLSPKCDSSFGSESTNRKKK